MNIAPRIISPLEFEGLSEKLILIEHDEDDDLNLISAAVKHKDNMIYTPEVMDIRSLWHDSYAANVSSIYKVRDIIKSIHKRNGLTDFHIINRIDMFDLNLDPRSRGVNISQYIGMIMSSRILSGANVIVTSCREEHKLREKTKHYINLRKIQ